MEYREFAAPPHLGRLVHAVWFLRAPAGGGAPQPVVPDGRIELVAHLGEPFSRLGADGRAERQQDFLVSGQLTRPLTLLPAGDAHSSASASSRAARTCCSASRSTSSPTRSFPCARWIRACARRCCIGRVTRHPG